MTRNPAPPQPRKSRVLPSASYPPEFMEIFGHVLATKQDVVINTLGAERSKYTTLSHKLNAWRKALNDEGSPVGASLYGVVVKVERRDGQWCCVLQVRSKEYGDKLTGLVVPPGAGPSPVPGPTPSPTPLPARPQSDIPAAADLIADLYGDPEKKGD